MATGRGGWSRIGMPINGTGYYQLLTPERVGEHPELDMSHLAVHYGVIAVQKRINGLGRSPRIPVDGIFGPSTDEALRWAQTHVGVTSDGQFGSRTSQAFFWPVIKDIVGAMPGGSSQIAHTVGGICMHESAFDPGAVGYSTPDDHGLVQINAPANPHTTIAQAFDHRYAFAYCAKRMIAALATYHSLDIAIASYASPAWAIQWFQTGKPPNAFVVAYADFVKSWKAP